MTAEAELQRFFSKNFVNVASGKVASQSSFSRWSKPGESSMAVSGAFPADFAFHTEFEEAPWWQLDLGEAYAADFILIYNRIKMAWDRAHHISVKSSLDGRTWETLHHGFTPFGGVAGLPLIVQIQKKRMRFVNISLAGHGALHLAQVQVLCSPPTVAVKAVRNAIRSTIIPDASRFMICVCGTSNSIQSDGYTATLSKHYSVEKFTNLSVGSSHNVLIPYAVTRSSLEEFDFILIDFCVNEQKISSVDLYNEVSAEDTINFIVKMCGDVGVVPIFLLLPTRDLEKTVAKKYMSHLRELNVPYIDVNAILEKIQNVTGLNYVELFRDDYHISPDVSSILGWSIGNILSNTIASKNLAPGEPERAFNKKLSYFDIFSSSPDVERKERVTSLRSANFSVLRPGKKLEILAEEASEVIGVVFNMSQSNGLLSIRGEDVNIKDLRTSYFDPDRGMWLVAWQLKYPVRAKDGRFVLECLASAETFIEANDHMDRPVQGQRAEVFIELAGLILRSPGDSAKLPAINFDIELTEAALALIDPESVTKARCHEPSEAL